MAKKSQIIPVQDLGHLFDGKYYGVFIDDTGGGEAYFYPDIPSHERVTYAAVIAQPQYMPKLVASLAAALNSLFKKYPEVDEFHFVDILNGRGPFRDDEDRFAYFKLFANIFLECDLHFIIVTTTSDTVREVETGDFEIIDLFVKHLKPHFDVSKLKHLALLRVLIQSCIHIREIRSCESDLALCLIDDGFFAKPHRHLKSTAFKNSFYESKISFVDSRLVWPIQLADFIAYSFNRMQHLLAIHEMRKADPQGGLSKWDKQFLEAINPVMERCINLKKKDIWLRLKETEGD